MSIRLTVDDVLWSQKGFPMENVEKRDPIVIGEKAKAKAEFNKAPVLELSDIKTNQWSPRDGMNVVISILVWNSIHQFKIAPDDFIDIQEELAENGEIVFKVQEESHRKENTSFEGRPAIVVDFTVNNDVIDMIVYTGHIGKPYDPNDTFDKYVMTVDRMIFESYYRVFINYNMVDDKMRTARRKKKKLVLHCGKGGN